MATPPTAAESTRPRFTVVLIGRDAQPDRTAEFVASLESQTFTLDRLEVIAVDNGPAAAPDPALADWQARRPDLVTVLHLPGAEPAAAGNAALDRARGDWVTFPDPAGVLDPAYFAEVDEFVTRRPDVLIAVTKRLEFDVDGEEVPDSRNRQFTSSNRLRNLDIDTRHFPADPAGTFLRLDVLRREGLRLDERVRPTFETQHLCATYLLRADPPSVGYLGKAVRRIRAVTTDGPDATWSDEGRFRAVPVHGYLALLHTALARSGRIPLWLQSLIVYELLAYLRTSDLVYTRRPADPGALVDFHDALAEILTLLDAEGIDGYETTPLPPTWRDILLHAYRAEPWYSTTVLIDKFDPQQEAMRATYRFTGEVPEERFVVDGWIVEPFAAKTRAITLFERTILYERLVWLPAGTVRVTLDGQEAQPRIGEPGRPARLLERWAIDARLRRALPPPPQPDPEDPRYSRAAAQLRWLAGTRPVRRVFGDAWVLMDRVFNADDSAEHLFRYLRKKRREVNAWFVVQRGTPDYKRLRRDGYKRIVPHGSLRWKLLMLNAAHLISSHIDEAIVAPEAITEITRPQWRFTFLQHGVIKDDLSTWFNRKDVEVFVASTPQEYESLVADGTTYRLTSREVKLTGLPRFDRIRKEGLKVPPEKRHRILVAPTWRQWLIVHEPPTNAPKRVVAETFRASDYTQQWTAFLSAPALREVAEQSGLTISLLLHPDLQRAVTLFDLPPYVELLRFEGENVQATFASARAVITDYSSMAFNAAYIDRPLVYFQFDAERMFGGSHIGRRGYFDYERDGFGPVAHTVDDALGLVVKTIQTGPEPERLYRERIAAAFPQRDGRCCQRAADAIAASVRPLKPKRRPLA